MARSQRGKVIGEGKAQSAGGDGWNNPALLERLRIDAEEQGVDVDEVMDGYVNPLTGIGDWTQDKRFGGQQFGPNFQVARISNYAAEARWRGSDLGARIVETIPDEMTREGFDVAVQPDEDEKDDKSDAFPALAAAPEFGAQPPPGQQQPDRPPTVQPREPQPLELDEEGVEVAQDLEDALAELGWDEAAYLALCYERAYGGALIYVGADDGAQSLTEPLDEKNIKSIDHLTVFSGGWDGEAVAWSYYRDLRKKNYGMPEMYMVRNLGVPIAKVPAPGESFQGPDVLLPGGRTPDSYGPLIYWIHESRFIKFPGFAVSPRVRVEMRGWGDSVFTRVDGVLRDFDQTWDGIANLMQSINQDVLSIEGLAERFAAGDKAAKGNPLSTRARQIQRTRSILRMLLIDKDKESFTRSVAPLTGVADVVDRLILRLAAAADMPADLLMGQSAAGGLNKGDTTLRFFYDRIRARQRRRLLKPLKHVLRLVQLAKEGPTDGQLYDKWSASFVPLYQQTELEKAQVRNTQAQTDQIYFNMGALTAAEITASRFGGSDWSPETQIDVGGRIEAADQDKKARDEKRKQMLEAAKKEPEPPGDKDPQFAGSTSVQVSISPDRPGGPASGGTRGQQAKPNTTPNGGVPDPANGTPDDEK